MQAYNQGSGSGYVKQFHSVELILEPAQPDALDNYQEF